MKENMRKIMSQTGILLITPLRLLKFFSGLAIIQLAVASFLQIGIGSDSFTVFQQGLSKVCSVSVGTANFLLTFVLLVIVFFLDRSQFKIGMVLSVAFAGLFLDAMTKLVKAVLPEAPTIPVIALEFALTCMVVCIGFPLLKSAGLGVAPNDALYLAISKRSKMPYGPVRILVDGCYLVIGYFLGGVIGIGTLVCVVVLGPMMQFVMNHIIRQDISS
ncbi:MAG: YitT family protein [Lachnospiraceae bacterium]